MNQVLAVVTEKFKASKFYLGSGLLLGVGFIEPTFWVLVFPGIALFIYAILAESSWQKAAWGGFLTFTIKALLAIVWFWTTYPIIWIDLSLGRAELPVVGFYWLTVGCFIGLGGLCGALVLYLLKSKLTSWFLFLTVPIVWLATEILGSFFFSLFTLGEGGTLNVVFSFGYVGYLLAEHPWLLPLASFGGVYLLTLVAVFGGTVFYSWLKKFAYQEKSKRLAALVFFALALSAPFVSWPFVSSSLGEDKTTVAIIDTSFGGSEYFALPDRETYRREQIIEALQAALATEAEYVVMPEDSRYVDPALTPSQAYSLFRFLQGDTEAVVVEAGRKPLTDGSTLRATIYDGVEKKAYGVDKQYLVPQGEFMPYFYTKTLALLGASQAAETINDKLQYRPGPLASQKDLPKHLPGVLFCFASADPLAVHTLTKARSLPFIAHPISHTWFHEPVSMWHQFDTMLKIHAVWNNVPIVSAGNMVEGALFTKEGKKVVPQLVASGLSWQVSLVSW
jgi:apolipoprotein N-acyltransferase